MNNWRWKLQNLLIKLFAGRYGIDELGRVLYLAGLVLLIGNAFLRNGLLSMLTTVILFYGLFRMYSKNIPARQQENARFLGWKQKLTGKASLTRSRFRDRKEYRYFRCEKCNQMVRVPKGKGEIEIRCPRCGNSFRRRT
ncbi:MAG: hypothetical protein IJM69_08185 [Firmicutes bacterium]|nr:hypothetical protein [Bacillota bacterium]